MKPPNPHCRPEDKRARLITTMDGKFINVKDCVAALQDDEFVNFCGEMLVVGREAGASPTECLRRAIALAFMTLAGDATWAHRERMKREAGE